MRPFWRSRYFVVGALLVVVGTGPLLGVIALAALGLTKDPNPNPIGLGLLAFLTFWPGAILMVLGVLTSRRRVDERSSDEGIRIRPGRADDAGWITELAPRLHEFGPPPWRDVAGMNAAVRDGLARELASPSPGSAILAAVDPGGTPLGFVSLRTDRDYFTEKPVGHVVDLVVARAGEGRGVGRALLGAAEGWAEEAGYPWLTLHVFEGNDRARRLYEQTGYAAEWTRMLKPIGLAKGR